MSIREQFESNKVPHIDSTIDGHPFPVLPKRFSTGSLGWYGNGKMMIEVEGEGYVQCQVAVTITVIGSKQ